MSKYSYTSEQEKNIKAEPEVQRLLSHRPNLVVLMYWPGPPEYMHAEIKDNKGKVLLFSLATPAPDMYRQFFEQRNIKVRIGEFSDIIFYDPKTGLSIGMH